MERESSARLRTVRNSLEWKGARMEMSIKWHVWWVSTDLGLSWFLTFSWVVVAMTWSPGNKPILDKLMLHVSMFLEGTVFIFIACFQYKKNTNALLVYCLFFFPDSFDQEPSSTEKDLNKNVKHLDFCQGQQLRWSHITCSNMSVLPLPRYASWASWYILRCVYQDHLHSPRKVERTFRSYKKNGTSIQKSILTKHHSLKLTTNNHLVTTLETPKPWKIKAHPRNLRWNLKISPWKRKVHLETIIFRFHVKFRGCTRKKPFHYPCYPWNPKIPNKFLPFLARICFVFGGPQTAPWFFWVPTDEGIPLDMGVSKNSGTPKWMVYNGKPEKNGWCGGYEYHYFRKHPYIPIQETHISNAGKFGSHSSTRNTRLVGGVFSDRSLEGWLTKMWYTPED